MTSLRDIDDAWLVKARAEQEDQDDAAQNHGEMAWQAVDLLEHAVAALRAAASGCYSVPSYLNGCVCSACKCRRALDEDVVA